MPQKPEGDEVTHTHTHMILHLFKVSTIIRREFVVKAKSKTQQRKQSYKKVNAGKTGTYE